MSRLQTFRTQLARRIGGHPLPDVSPNLLTLEAGQDLSTKQAGRPLRENWVHAYGSGTDPGLYRSWLRKVSDIPSTPQGRALAAEATLWASVCIELWTGVVSRMNWAVYTKSPATANSKRQKLEDTPFHRLVSWSQRVLGQNLFYKWEQSLKIHGEAYFEKCYQFPQYRAGAGGLYLLNPIAITPWVQSGTINCFDYQTEWGSNQYAPQDIFFHRRYPSALDDFRGTSPMTAALDSINVDRSSQNAIKMFFQNAYLSPGYFTWAKEGLANGAPDTQTLERVKAEMTAQFMGPENAYSTGLFTAPLDYHEISNDPPEHQDELDAAQRQRICAKLHVNPALVGAADVSDSLSASSTLRELKAAWYENEVIPECDELARFINEMFLPWLGMDDRLFEFDYSNIYSLTKYNKDNSDRARSEFQGSAITFNQMQIQLGYDPVAGGDFYLFPSGMQVVKVDQGKIEPPLAPAQLPPDQPALPPVENKDITPALPSGQSATLLLTLPNQPDLIALQRQVGKYVGEAQVEWNAPDTFHVTLVSLPSITDEQLAQLTAALGEVEVPELELKVGSLGAFEGVGRYPVHFRVRKNDDLIELQEMLYDLCQSIGLPMSRFSTPADYNPHITMGYSSVKPRVFAYRSKITVRPAELQLTKGTEVVFRRTIGDEDEPPPDEPTADSRQPSVKTDGETFDELVAQLVDNPVDSVPVPVQVDEDETFEAWVDRLKTDWIITEPRRLNPLDELAAWERKALAKGKSAAFQTYVISGAVAEAVRYGLAESDDAVAIKAVFDRAREVLGVKAITSRQAEFERELQQLFDDLSDEMKSADETLAPLLLALELVDDEQMVAKAIQATRLDFEMAFEDLLAEARKDDASKRRARGKLAALLNKYNKLAYLDGLTDGGIEDAELDEEDRQAIADLLAEQSQYVSRFINSLFASGISDAMATNKPAQWFNGSIYPAYQRGLLSADRNGLYEWVLGQTEQHCESCLALNGQVHRLKDYHRRKLLPKSSILICGAGKHCDCGLVRRKGKVTGSLAAVPLREAA